MYQDTITAYSIPVLNDRYDMLRQLGNVYLVQPEILKSYLNESYLARIDNRLLRPFVQQRTDYNDFSKKYWDQILGETTTGGMSGSEAMGKVGAGLTRVTTLPGNAQARLGGLMRDLSLRMEKDRPLSTTST